MKKTITLFLIAAVLVGCSRDEFLPAQSKDGLIEVSFNTESSEPDTKVWSGWVASDNLMYWSACDSVGLFAGYGNVNRKFVLSSGANKTSATFNGLMESVSSPVTLIVYYPYTEGATMQNIPFPNMDNQIFEGTFDKNGEFRNLGDYALLVGKRNSFTLLNQWPTGAYVNFSTLVGIVRFELINNRTEALMVRQVGIHSVYHSLTNLTYYNPTTGLKVGYYTNDRNTTISEKNPLLLEESQTKYVQMAATYSNFYKNDSLQIYIKCIDSDGQCQKLCVDKIVNPVNNIRQGKRTSITVPINNNTTKYSANMVKVLTSSTTTTLTSPVFRQDADDYEAAETVWGDSSIEKYEAERVHTYTTTGEHSASFNHWGESNLVTFKSLKGITAIDFSKVF